MEYSQAEILQTVAMTEMEHLDVRTVTLGLSLLDCSGDSIAVVAEKAAQKIRSVASRLVEVVDEIGDEIGISRRRIRGPSGKVPMARGREGNQVV